MTRAIPILFVLALKTAAVAEELKLRPLARGSIGEKNADPKSVQELQALCPRHGVIDKQADLEKLCKAWSIEVPKVDFKNELVVAGTWKGSTFSAKAMLADGALQVRFMGTKDLRPGFRYLLAACPSEKVKSIVGKNK